MIERDTNNGVAYDEASRDLMDDLGLPAPMQQTAREAVETAVALDWESLRLLNTEHPFLHLMSERGAKQHLIQRATRAESAVVMARQLLRLFPPAYRRNLFAEEHRRDN